MQCLQRLLGFCFDPVTDGMARKWSAANHISSRMKQRAMDQDCGLAFLNALEPTFTVVWGMLPSGDKLALWHALPRATRVGLHAVHGSSVAMPRLGTPPLPFAPNIAGWTTNSGWHLEVLDMHGGVSLCRLLQLCRQPSAVSCVGISLFLRAFPPASSPLLALPPTDTVAVEVRSWRDWRCVLQIARELVALHGCLSGDVEAVLYAGVAAMAALGRVENCTKMVSVLMERLHSRCLALPHPLHAALVGAAWCGDTRVLRQLAGLGYFAPDLPLPCNALTALVAALKGDVRMLAALRGLGAPMSVALTSAAAASGGHIPVLQWLADGAAVPDDVQCAPTVEEAMEWWGREMGVSAEIAAAWAKRSCSGDEDGSDGGSNCDGAAGGGGSNGGPDSDSDTSDSADSSGRVNIADPIATEASHWTHVTLHDTALRAARMGRLTPLSCHHCIRDWPELCRRALATIAQRSGHEHFVAFMDVQSLHRDPLPARLLTALATGDVRSALPHDLETVTLPQQAVLAEAAAVAGQLASLDWLHAHAKRGAVASREVLQSAARYGRLRVVQWLLEHGCAPSSAACGEAAQGAHVEVMAALVARGCDITRGVLLAAVESGCERTVRWLLPRLQAARHPAALTAAVECGRLHIAQALHEAGHGVQGCDLQLNALSLLLLHCALRGRLRAARWVLEHAPASLARRALDVAQARLLAMDYPQLTEVLAREAETCSVGSAAGSVAATDDAPSTERMWAAM